jgi:glutamyl-tRNA synthetase
LAKKYGGDFVLRIEDTDQDRFVEGATDKIYKIHDILGLIPDEDPRVGGKFGPYIQTERLETYKKYAQELINIGAAYYCFCSEDRLKELHKDNLYAKYDRHCRNLSAEEVQSKLDSKTPYVIRCKLPETGFTVWHDLVQGKLSLPNTECDDKVLLKTSGIPTYHLAVVVDDHLMEITHALRGVEWMMSTPIHIFLFESLGWQPPILAHVPLLLGPDKSKLSKRHGAKSVLEYVDEGFLPEAINNFLFYLGFSYKDNSSLLSLEEMVQIFDETRLQKQNCIFDIERLRYMNSQWIKKLDLEILFTKLKPYLPDSWQSQTEKIKGILPLVRDRMILLTDFMDDARYFFEDIAVSKDEVMKQTTQSESILVAWFKVVTDYLQNSPRQSAEEMQASLQALQKESSLSPREAFMSLRVALSGRTVTPHIFDCIQVLGTEESIKRLKSVYE